MIDLRGQARRKARSRQKRDAWRRPSRNWKQRAPGAAGRRGEAHRGAARQGPADRARAADACCSIRAASKNMTCTSSIIAPTSAWRRRRSPATAWSPDRARSTAGWSSSSPRISPCSAARCQRAPRAEDLQGHGHGDEGRRAGHRPQRQRRRAHPGGRRQPRRLCRSVPAQRARQRRHPADQPDHGPVRGRRGLFAGDDRLHLHGEGFSPTCSSPAPRW